MTSLYMPNLWMVVTLQLLATAAISPLAICIFLTLAATAPAEMRTICFAMFGVYALVFGGFAGGVLLGAVSDAAGYLHGPTVALTLIGPVCVIGGVMLLLGSRHVKRDITMVIEDVLERYAEGSAPPGRGGAAGAAGPQPRRLLRRQPGALRRERRRGRRGDRGPARHERGRQVDPAAHRGRARSTPTGG